MTQTARTTATPGTAAATARAADVPRVLARCTRLVAPELTRAVDSLHPWPRRMAAYTFGWCEADGEPAPGAASGGKGVRQALAVLCAEAAGAPGASAAPGAVAVELVHAFSLVHDDIMDGDERRRHRASAWKAYGTGPAVLAGDAMLALAMSTLATGVPGEHAAAATARLTGSLHDLLRGQAEDLLFETRPWSGPRAVTVGEYWAMAEDKTGTLLGCAMALGALLGGAPPAVVDAVDRCGRHLGLAYQAVDDLLGIWGDPAVTGKPVHGDLRRGKKTLPVLTALSQGGAPARHLAELLESGPGLDEDDARIAAGLVALAGGREAARERAGHHARAARASLLGAPLAPGPVAELLALCDFLVGRTS